MGRERALPKQNLARRGGDARARGARLSLGELDELAHGYRRGSDGVRLRDERRRLGGVARGEGGVETANPSEARRWRREVGGEGGDGTVVSDPNVAIAAGEIATETG